MPKLILILASLFLLAGCCHYKREWKEVTVLDRFDEVEGVSGSGTWTTIHLKVKTQEGLVYKIEGGNKYAFVHPGDTINCEIVTDGQ